MNFVEPIRDMKKISQIKNILRGEGNIRDLLLFELGINSALRISDLLRLKVEDLYYENMNIREFFNIVEEKTGKVNRITITPKVIETLRLYSTTYPDVVSNRGSYIFFQRKSFPHGIAPIGRKMSWLIVSNICKSIGLGGNYGNHTLRKTWAFQARMQGIPIEIIQHKLNHSSLVVTQHYLGITADEIADACRKLDL